MLYYWQRYLLSEKVLNSLIILATVVISSSYGNSVLAQITPDESLGNESSVVTPNVEIKGKTADRIDGGAIRESNLFHSFSEFNVGEGQNVYFANPNNIENIFTRITGNNPSNILGTLGVDGAANLLLLNPNGIMFGKNSSLDIEGSFFGTTAESLLFRDGGKFSAVEPQSSLLTISVPLGLQLGANPGNIMVQSPLKVQPGQNLTLLGGDINLEGTNIEVINGFNTPADGIIAPGGKVELGGLGTAGEIRINNDGSLNFPEGVTKADVTLNNYGVDVRAGGGGFVTVNGRNLELFDSGIIAGVDFSIDFAQAQAGDIVINTSEKILLANSTGSISEISNTTGDFSAFITPENNTINTRGNAGDITINTGILEMIGASGIGSVGIGSTTNGEGNAGNVEIKAKERISLTGEGEFNVGIGSLVGELGTGNGANVIITTPSLSVSNSFVSTQTNGQGTAGNIEITSDSLIVQEGGQIGTQAQENATGKAGNLKIVASDLVQLSGSLTRLSTSTTAKNANAGNLSIEAEQLTITDGAQIQAITTGDGNGGNIDIQASSIEMFGVSENSPSAIAANTFGAGNGGDIEITTDSLIMRDGGQIGTEAQENATGKAGDLKIAASELVQLSGMLTGLSTSTSAENANAGNVSIETEQLILTDGAQILAVTRGDGNGGDIDIQVSSINISGSLENVSSGIFANTFGVGNGGNIEITSDSLIVRDGGKIVTEARENATGKAGDLKIFASELVQLNGMLTGLSTSTFAENASAGNLSIETEQLSITDEAQIIAVTEGEGNGGNIDIQASSIEILGISGNISSGIFANTLAAGNGGNIEITSDRLIVEDGGRIVTEAQGTTGKAGDLTIFALDLVQLSGSFTRLSNSTGAENADAGNFIIKTEQLNITEGAQIRALTIGDGNGGDINIQASSINISGNTINSPSGIFASSGGTSPENNEIIAGFGNGGKVDIKTNDLVISDGAGISVGSLGDGNAGKILVTVRDSFLANNGVISSFSDRSSGGNIEITASDIRLRGDSDIRTNVKNGAGGGGNITLTANSVVAFDDSDIVASSRDGVGGDIKINSPVLFVNGFSVDSFNADPESLENNNRADLNASGAVSFGSIDIPDVNFLSNSLAELSENAINTEELVSNSCVVRDRSSRGTFIITGKGGLPMRPSNWAVSTYPTGDVRTIPHKAKATSTNNWQPGEPIVEPQGIYRLSNGKLVLSRECS